MEQQKMCKRCVKAKPETSEFFYKNQRNRNGLDHYCKPCRKEVSRARPKRAVRDTELRRLYGITLDQYELLLDVQGGVCAICGGPPRGKKYLSVDHCHSGGEVRGLLCDPCNRALGMFKHDPELLERAKGYLLDSVLRSQ